MMEHFDLWKHTHTTIYNFKKNTHTVQMENYTTAQMVQYMNVLKINLPTEICLCFAGSQPRGGHQRRELYFLFGHKSLNRFHEILSLQSGTIPTGHVLQTICHRMVSAVKEIVFSARHSKRRLGRNSRCCGQCVCYSALQVCSNLADQPASQGFLGSEFSGSIAQFPHQAMVTDHFGQPTERAQVCSNTNVNLLDREEGVG
mmetsp:Transcript_46789/g.92069  ORF Transcript_46789/g.92069 Transcript_46789/m.92069 type:complete len:201 (+) Transcript_46789:84-686(+)